MGTKRVSKKKQSKNQPDTRREKLPFIEHLYELRKRLFYVALSIGVGSLAAYGVQQSIVGLLLKPAEHQKFIYTSPGGGIDFLFRVCLYTGVALSIPVIVYQLLRYTEPLMKKSSVRFIAWGSIVSGILAFAGILVGYFIGLPAAMTFLLHQFTTSQISALLTIQAYMSFVTMYLLGSALLFQMPLILIFINRIKPLAPKALFKYERWVIVAAIIMGAIMNPSPRLQDQFILAGPIIITYQIGIAIIWWINRQATRRRPKRVAELLKKDAASQAARIQRFKAARAAWVAASQEQPASVPLLASARPKPTSRPVAAAAVQPRPALVQTASTTPIVPKTPSKISPLVLKSPTAGHNISPARQRNAITQPSTTPQPVSHRLRRITTPSARPRQYIDITAPRRTYQTFTPHAAQ